MKKKSTVAVFSLALWAASSMAADMSSIENDLHLRVTSIETTVAALHQKISTLNGALANLQASLRDLPPPAMTAPAMTAASACRPPVNRCTQRRH